MGKYTGQCSSSEASERIERAIIFFRSKLVITQRAGRLLSNTGGHAASGRCIRTLMVRQRVIGEPPTLIHNVAPKRAEIGRLRAFFQKA